MTVSLRTIMRWLYPLFFFTLPFQARWIVHDAIISGSVWEYGRVSIYGFDVVLMLINILILFIYIQNNSAVIPTQVENQTKQENKKRFFLFLFSGSRIEYGMTLRRHGWESLAIGFAVYELAVSLDPLLTAVVLARVALMSVAGWFLIRHAGALVLRRSLAVFVFAMTLSAGFGVAQFFAQDSLIVSKWLGVSWQDPAVLGVSVIEAQGGRWLRAHGTMPHPNALGGFSALALVLFLILVAVRFPEGDDTGRILRGRFFDSCRCVFVVAAPLLLAVGVITSASRAALIAAVVGAGAIFWLAFHRSHWSTLFLPLAGAAAGALVILIATLPILAPRLTARGRLESISIERRLSAFEESVDVFKAYGTLGTGLGSYTAALQALFPGKKIWEQQPVHNIPILLIIELGVGGLLILGFGIWILMRSQKFTPLNSASRGGAAAFNGVKVKSRKIRWLIPLFICWFVLAILDHYLWTLPTGLYLSVFLWSVYIFRRDIE